MWFGKILNRSQSCQPAVDYYVCHSVATQTVGSMQSFINFSLSHQSAEHIASMFHHVRCPLAEHSAKLQNYFELNPFSAIFFQ
jgi:hypothetical protein